MPVIVTTGHGEVDPAVQAMTAGAVDFIVRAAGGRGPAEAAP